MQSVSVLNCRCLWAPFRHVPSLTITEHQPVHWANIGTCWCLADLVMTYASVRGPHLPVGCHAVMVTHMRRGTTPPPPPKKKKTAESFIHVRQKLNSNMLPTCNRQIICVINDSLFPFWRLDNEMRKLTSSGWYRKALHERFGNLCKLQWIWHSFAVKVLHEKIEDRKITLDDLAFSADQLPIANQFCFTSQTMELTYNSASLIFKRKKFTICKSETQLRSCEGCDIISLEKKVSWRRSIDAWFVIVLNKEERKVKKDVFDLTKTYTMRACKSDRIARDVHKGHESNKNVSLESIDLVHQNKLQETAKFAVWLGEMTCQIQP